MQIAKVKLEALANTIRNKDCKEIKEGVDQFLQALALFISSPKPNKNNMLRQISLIENSLESINEKLSDMKKEIDKA